jgi:hypothetical protein
MNNTGFINGYRWGVEYPTNGSKPNLPDDVIIQLSAPMCRGSLSVFAGSAMYAAKGATFKIIDERYKPEDTSYLDEYFAVQGIDQQKIKNTLISDIAEQGWYCYETQKAMQLPPVGVEILYGDSKYFVVAHHSKRADDVIASTGEDYGQLIYLYWRKAKPLDHATRKAEAGRKRVVEAAILKLASFSQIDFDSWQDILTKLHDAGFLRMPEDK